jgi:hypothetical protein
VLRLPLTVGRVGDTIASTQELEVRMGALQRELEFLSGKQERLRRRAIMEYLAVHVWHQPPEAALPEGLASFLARPLGELGRYYYVQCRASDGGVFHYVASKDRLSAGAAMAVACKQTYLCESRWYEWGLPLFVRHDCALSLDISEGDMAAKVRELLPPLSQETNNGCERWLLVEPGRDDSGRDNREPGELQYTQIELKETLDCVLKLTNGKSESPSTIAFLASHDADASAPALQVAASAEAQQLDDELLKRTGIRLKQIESNWEAARRGLQAAEFNTRLSEIAQRTLEASYLNLPDTWKTFVDRVLEANSRVAYYKLEQLGQWDSAEPDRLNRLQEYGRSLANTGQMISERRRAYDAVLPPITAKCAELETALRELEEKKRELDAKEALITERSRKLSEANTALEQSIKTIDAKAQELESQIQRSNDLIRQRKDAEQGLAETEEEARQKNAADEASNERLARAIRAAQNLLKLSPHKKSRFSLFGK